MLAAWRLIGYLAALGAVALVSLSIGVILGQVSLANLSMLYLFAVLAAAVALPRAGGVRFGAGVSGLRLVVRLQPLPQFFADNRPRRRCPLRLQPAAGPRAGQRSGLI